MIILMVAIAGLTAGCGQAPESQVAAPANLAMKRDPRPAPVTDPAAPTIAQLERRGLVRVDDEPANAPSCGPDCVMDAFSAVYMGRDTEHFPPDRQFICPVADGEMESWRCRAVEEAHG